MARPQNPDPRRSIVPLDEGDAINLLPRSEGILGPEIPYPCTLRARLLPVTVFVTILATCSLVEDIGAFDRRRSAFLAGAGPDRRQLSRNSPQRRRRDRASIRLDSTLFGKAFNELEITPVRGSGFAPARSLVSSPGEFRNLLSESDLPYLLRHWRRSRPSKPLAGYVTALVAQASSSGGSTRSSSAGPSWGSR